jgi:hypothetical protein
MCHLVFRVYRRAGTEDLDKSKEVRVFGSEQEKVQKAGGNCMLGSLKIYNTKANIAAKGDQMEEGEVQHVECMEDMRNAYVLCTIFVGKPDEKRLLGRPRATQKTWVCMGLAAEEYDTGSGHKSMSFYASTCR